MNDLDHTYGKCTCGGGLPGPVESCDSCMAKRFEDRSKRERMREEQALRLAEARLRHDGIRLGVLAEASPLPAPPPPKPPLEYVLDLPRALAAIARQLQFGASKPERSRGGWRQDYDTSEKRMEVIAKVARHLLARHNGELLDEEGRPHAVAALADLAIFVELEGT